jgi:paraquat-inducible protein B
MSQKVHAAVIGLFVLVAIVIAIIAIVMLGTRRFGQPVAPALVYFKDPVAGLDPGAPVEWNGVLVGHVAEIRLVYDSSRNAFRTPVRIELEQDRIDGLADRQPATLLEKLRQDVAAGLRARLEMQSLLTGKLKVVLVTLPNEPPVAVAEENGLFVVPSVSSPFDVFTQQLGNLPLERIVNTLDKSLNTAAQMLDELKSGGAASNLNATLAISRQIAAQIEAARVDELAQQARALTADVTGLVATGGVREAISNANALLASARDTVTDLRRQAITTREDVSRAARETADAARSVRILAETLEQHPEVLLRGKKEEQP